MERLTGAHRHVTSTVATIGLVPAAAAAVVCAFEVGLAEPDELAGDGREGLGDVLGLVDGDAVVEGQFCGLDLTLDCGKGKVGGGPTLAGTGDVAEGLGETCLAGAQAKGLGQPVVGDNRHRLCVLDLFRQGVGLGRVLVGQDVEVLALELGFAEVTLALVVGAEDDRLELFALLDIGSELDVRVGQLSDLGAKAVDLALQVADLALVVGRDECEGVGGVLHGLLLLNGRGVGGRGGSKERKDGVDLRHDGLHGWDLAKVQESPHANPYSLVNVEKIARPKAYQIPMQSLIVTTSRWASSPCSANERRRMTNRSRPQGHASG